MTESNGHHKPTARPLSAQGRRRTPWPLALVSFNDAQSRAELRAMLRPYTFNAPIAGQLVSILPAGTPVKREAMLARVRVNSGQLVEIRSPLPGRIEQLAVAPDAQITQG